MAEPLPGTSDYVVGGQYGERMLFEAAAIDLGAAIIRVACGISLGEPVEATAGITEYVRDRVAGRMEQRQAVRLFDNCADLIANRLLSALTVELSNVPENEREAAVLAVTEVLRAARVDTGTLMSKDLDPHELERHLAPSADAVLQRAALSSDGDYVFWFVLRESCAYLVQAVGVLPDFTVTGFAELLHRQTQITERLRIVLDRLPRRRAVEDFEADYLRQVATLQDRMEIFGAQLEGPARSYPLSIAYLTLSSAAWDGWKKRSARPAIRRVDDVLCGQQRLMIVGEAGSGKTTLLRWLAVRSASATFPPALEKWNRLIPFTITLRRFVDAQLPPPEDFLNEIAAPLAGELPDQAWVHTVLREGRGLVLIDGIDELPERQRPEARRWLEQLVVAFPEATWVISSRPEAMDDQWESFTQTTLSSPAGRFVVAQLQPMSPTHVRAFVHLWHAAIREVLTDPAEQKALLGYETAVVNALAADRHLRRLAVNPLLCALLCALNRKFRTNLPHSRMAIYSAALDMLLEGRDRERNVADDLSLTMAQRTYLVQGLALWLIRNGRSDATLQEAADCFAATLRSLATGYGPQDAERLLRRLLERSGLIREPVAGRVDFVHRTFQEYLAAKAIVEDNGVGELIRNAHDDQWREVIVLAAGHAQPHQCEELLRGLLDARDPDDVRTRLLPIACLQTVERLGEGLRREIEESARDVVPPRTQTVAEILAAAGDFVLDLLPPPTDLQEAEATLQTAQLIGGDDALAVISRLAENPAWENLRNQFLSGWPTFPVDAYAERVLSHLSFDTLTLPVDATLASLRHIRTDALALQVKPGHLTWPDEHPATMFPSVTSLTLTRMLLAYVAPWVYETMGDWLQAGSSNVEVLIEDDDHSTSNNPLWDRILDRQALHVRPRLTVGLDRRKARQLYAYVPTVAPDAQTDQHGMLLFAKGRREEPVQQEVLASFFENLGRRLPALAHINLIGPTAELFAALRLPSSVERLTIVGVQTTDFVNSPVCDGIKQATMWLTDSAPPDLTPLASMLPQVVKLSLAMTHLVELDITALLQCSALESVHFRGQGTVTWSEPSNIADRPPLKLTVSGGAIAVGLTDAVIVEQQADEPAQNIWSIATQFISSAYK